MITGTHAKIVVRRFLLLFHCIDYALDRRFEEGGHVRSLQLELTISDVTSLVVISCRPKLNETWLFSASEPQLGGFVETRHDMIEIVQEGGVMKIFYDKVQRWTLMNNVARLTF